MKGWSLRTRLTLVLATMLSVFALLSTVAYLTSSREEDRLERAFAEELSFLSDLPAQRARLRRIDMDADSYLLTRREEWLARRGAAILEFRSWDAKLSARLESGPQAQAWREADADFDGFVAAQDEVLARAKSGRMSREEAERATLAKNKLDALIEREISFGRLSFDRLDARRRAARSAAFATFGFVLGVGVLGAIALSAAISRVVVAPVLRLRRQAAAWKLGEPWPLPPGDEPREVRELMETMRAMAVKLNEQYERERAASRLKSQLVSGVSHEFNNALAVMHTAHVLLQESGSDEAGAPWHEMLEANIGALSAMATNLLNLGRLEAGRFELELQRVELEPLLRSALDRLAILGRRKKLSMSVEIADGLPAVKADPAALPLVVTNLLTNAFKYTGDGGAVALGARLLPDGRVEVYVRDTGIGVAPEDREKIFGGYYRTETGKRTAKGFGVGLALSRMILEAHGAALSLESAPGQGSRFSFALDPYA